MPVRQCLLRLPWSSPRSCPTPLPPSPRTATLRHAQRGLPARRVSHARVGPVLPAAPRLPASARWPLALSRSLTQRHTPPSRSPVAGPSSASCRSVFRRKAPQSGGKRHWWGAGGAGAAERDEGQVPWGPGGGSPSEQSTEGRRDVPARDGASRLLARASRGPQEERKQEVGRHGGGFKNRTSCVDGAGPPRHRFAVAAAFPTEAHPRDVPANRPRVPCPGALASAGALCCATKPPGRAAVPAPPLLTGRVLASDPPPFGGTLGVSK